MVWAETEQANASAVAINVVDFMTFVNGERQLREAF
jgi:hypothetical protein